MRMKTFIKITQVIVVTVFLVILIGPGINGSLHLIAETKGNENRAKARKPAINQNGLDTFIKAYDRYYTDNFSLRENLISFHNKFEYSLFDVSSIPENVVVGKDNWFYDKNNLPNYKGTNSLTEKELAELKLELETRTKWAAVKGIKYYVAVVPNKMNVYPEYLPNNIQNTTKPHLYDQLVGLNNNSTINVIDVKSNLLRHKNEDHTLYQLTDGHWNDLGAYYGYEAILKRLALDYPELEPIALSNYTIKIEETVGAIARMMNIEKEHPEHFVTLKEKFASAVHDGEKRPYPLPPTVSEWEFQFIKVNEKGKKIKCLIIRDSFTQGLIHYLQEHFKETVFIHDEWKYRMREDIIMAEKPDIVLNIILENEIPKLLKYPFVAEAANEEAKDTVQILAANNKYVCADITGELIADRNEPGRWETFSLIRLEDGTYSIMSHQDLLWSLGKSNSVAALGPKVSGATKLQIIDLGDGFIALKTLTNKYLGIDPATNKLVAIKTSVGASEKFRLQKK
jgi:alginate O-acetyltransferase complex protein AlgJ